MLASMEHKSEAGVAKRRGAQTTSTKFVANYVMCLHIHWSLFITLFVVLQMLENMGIVGIVHIVSLHISLCKKRNVLGSHRQILECCEAAHGGRLEQAGPAVVLLRTRHLDGSCGIFIELPSLSQLCQFFRGSSATE